MARVALLANPSLDDNIAKRTSEYGIPSTAIKVESPYQSYLNHPFTQQQHVGRPHNMTKSTQPQKTQSYVSKYSSYTNSSRGPIHLITIPTSTAATPSHRNTSSTKDLEKTKSAMGCDHELNSPTSPLVSPPPPYLSHQQHSDHGDNRFIGLDNKHPDQYAQWPSMMKLSTSTGVTTTTADLTRPKMARMLPPQAIPILTTTGPGGGLPLPLRSSLSFDNNPLSPEVCSPPTSNSLRSTLLLDASGVHLTHVVHQNTSSVSSTILSYPTFWQVARQSKTNQALVLLGGLALIGLVVGVALSQVFLGWLAVVPAVGLPVLSMQFARYRIKRSQFVLQDTKDASLATAAASSLSIQASLEYLQSHQPRYDYDRPPCDESQPQQESQQLHVRFQKPFDQQSYKQPRGPSATGSVSTGRKPNLHLPLHQQQLRVTPASAAAVNNGSPYYQNPHFLSPVDSPQTPPPAYFFMKKIELPEIDSVVGDLVSEFEIDFDAIKY